MLNNFRMLKKLLANILDYAFSKTIIAMGLALMVIDCMEKDWQEIWQEINSGLLNCKAQTPDVQPQKFFEFLDAWRRIPVCFLLKITTFKLSSFVIFLIFGL